MKKILFRRLFRSNPASPVIDQNIAHQNNIVKTCLHCRQVFAFVLLLCACIKSDGQSINLSDSLRHVLRNKPVPTVKLDSRNSFITGQSARIYGVKIGLSYIKRLSFGLGYNWLLNDFETQVSLPTGVVNGNVEMRYIAPFVDYSFFKKGPWEANVPVQLGFGRSFIKLGSDAGNSVVSSGGIVLYEPSMTVEYKILNLIGVGGGLGYRIMLKNNKLIDEQFSSPVYVIRLRIIFDEVYQRYMKQQKSGD